LGIHIMEVRRRNGTRVMLPLSKIVVEKNDRFLVALHRRRGGAAKPEAELFETGIGADDALHGGRDRLRTWSCAMSRHCSGSPSREADFRQRFTTVWCWPCTGTATNITSRIAELRAGNVGDTLLVITALQQPGRAGRHAGLRS
jgi:hypothetical protein